MNAATLTLARGGRTAHAYAGIGPSCAGGAHRRCLLTADQCVCPCHRGELAGAVGPAPTGPATFECPACRQPFGNPAARAGHLEQAHPIGWKPADDLALDPPVLSRVPVADIERALHHNARRCPICNHPFETKRSLALHIVYGHTKASQRAEDEGGADGRPGCAPAGGNAPGSTVAPVGTS